MIPEQVKFTYPEKPQLKKPKKFTVADQLAVLRDKGRPRKGEEV